MITILALDPGLSFGWALDAPDEPVTFGVWDLKGGRHEAFGVPFHRLRLKLSEVHKAHPLELVVYEVSPFQKKTAAARMAGGFEATIAAWCELNEVSYREVNTATVKKDVANIPSNLERDEAKRRMIQAMQRRGFAVTEEDAADALAVLEWARGAMRQRELWEEAA